MNKVRISFMRVLCRKNVISHSKQVGNQFRSMSIAHTPPAPHSITGTLVSKDDYKAFLSVFPELIRNFTENSSYSGIPDVNKWLEKLLQYNMPDGKKLRALALIYSFRMLCPKSELTDENLKLCYILGWCVEMLLTYTLILDDIMDNAITRRGHLCWYRNNNIGLTAINDVIFLEAAVFQLLENYFKDKTYYVHFLELFQDASMNVAIGQCLDMMIPKSFKSSKLEKYTMENYSAIVKYKTSYSLYYHPVCLAMRMANINDQEFIRQTKTILLEMGHFFQVQDDYLDCYGNPKIMGKIGTDIEDGKCSWLAVVALQKANSRQRRILEDNYGINDPAKVKIIKDLYEELELPSTFKFYEEESYNLICTHIQQISQGLPQEIFYKFLERLYKRTN